MSGGCSCSWISLPNVEVARATSVGIGVATLKQTGLTLFLERHGTIHMREKSAPATSWLTVAFRSNL
jgi:hypothetical protein